MRTVGPSPRSVVPLSPPRAFLRGRALSMVTPPLLQRLQRTLSTSDWEADSAARATREAGMGSLIQLNFLLMVTPLRRHALELARLGRHGLHQHLHAAPGLLAARLAFAGFFLPARFGRSCCRCRVSCWASGRSAAPCLAPSCLVSSFYRPSSSSSSLCLWVFASFWTWGISV